MQIAINNSIYQQAQNYAQQRGRSLTSIIESFLLKFISHDDTATEQAIPDVVQSLYGAGAPISESDLNGREAYNKYLEEKYK